MYVLNGLHGFRSRLHQPTPKHIHTPPMHKTASTASSNHSSHHNNRTTSQLSAGGGGGGNASLASAGTTTTTTVGGGKEKKSKLRTPSYTDRILTHSLPGAFPFVFLDPSRFLSFPPLQPPTTNHHQATRPGPNSLLPTHPTNQTPIERQPQAKRTSCGGGTTRWRTAWSFPTTGLSAAPWTSGCVNLSIRNFCVYIYISCMMYIVRGHGANM